MRGGGRQPAHTCQRDVTFQAFQQPAQRHLLAWLQPQPRLNAGGAAPEEHVRVEVVGMVVYRPRAQQMSSAMPRHEFRQGCLTA